MTDDTTQPAGALPEPAVLARNAYNWVIATGYTADQMRAMMAERDAAREERDAALERAEFCLAFTRDAQDLCATAQAEAAALRRELEELRAQPTIAYLRSLTHPDWIETCQSDAPGAFPAYARPIPPDAREGREPLTPEQQHALWQKANGEWLTDEADFKAGIRAAERAHGIGPAGTSADGETR